MNTRRGFVLGGVLSAASLTAAAARYANRLRLTNDGLVSFDFVRWNPFITPAPDFSGLPPNAEVRVRNTFPYQERDVIETFVYVKLPNNGTAPISMIYTEVEEVQIAESETGMNRKSIAMYGKVIGNPIPSPFGPIVGRGSMFGGTFDKVGQNTRFDFFGGLVAGSHATIVPVAYGTLEIKTPWQSL